MLRILPRYAPPFRDCLSPHGLHPLTNSSTRALFNTTLLLEASRTEFYLLCLLSHPTLDLALKHPVPPTDRGHFLCTTAVYKSPCHLLCNQHVSDTMLQSLHSFCHFISTATLWFRFTSHFSEEETGGEENRAWPTHCQGQSWDSDPEPSTCLTHTGTQWVSTEWMMEWPQSCVLSSLINLHTWVSIL